METFVGVFSKEEVATLRPLLSLLHFFTHTSNLGMLLNAFATPFDDSLIIDLGASCHMLSISSLFSSYNLCSEKENVRITDGSVSSVSGKSSILVTPPCHCPLSFISQILQPSYCPLLILPVS